MHVVFPTLRSIIFVTSLSPSLAAKPEKLSRKERRALRLARRKDGGLVRDLLRNWEELRAGHCEPSRRSELCSAIIEATRGKVRELVMAHDTSRVFESVMKHGSMEQRLTVLEELKNDVSLFLLLWVDSSSKEVPSH